MWDSIVSVLQNQWFWLVLAVAALAGYSAAAIGPLKRIPIVNTSSGLLLVAGAAFAVTSGVLGVAGFGDANTGSFTGPQGFVISDLQTTDSFEINNSGSALSENANVPDLLDVRLEDLQVQETAAMLELDDGLITVTRTGDLKPASCPVTVSLPNDNYPLEAGSDGTLYSIVQKNSLGEGAVFLGDGGLATTSSPRMKNTLTFADGDATQTLGVVIEVDEEGHDALSTYSFRDVVVDVCGKPYTFRIHAMN